MSDLPKTWQELKRRFEDAPKPSNLKVTCICGEHDPVVLTDEDYKLMFNILTEGYTPMT